MATFDVDVTYDGYPPILTTLGSLTPDEVAKRVKRWLTQSATWETITIRRSVTPP